MNAVWAWLRRRLLRPGARDAELGISVEDDYILARVGPPLERSADPFHPDAAAVYDAQPAELAEFDADERRLEDALAGYPPLPVLDAGLVFVSMAEAAASILLFRELGVDGPERLVFGIMNALALIGASALCVWAATHQQRTGVHRRHWSFPLLIAAYALLFLAIALVRQQMLSSEDADTSVNLATTLLLLVTSIAPAFFTEWLLRKRVAPARLQRERRLITKRRSAALARRTRAQAHNERLAQQIEQRRRQEDRLRAQYRLDHQRHTAQHPEERQ